jgi:hypothetical protein
MVSLRHCTNSLTRRPPLPDSTWPPARNVPRLGGGKRLWHLSAISAPTRASQRLETARLNSAVAIDLQSDDLPKREQAAHESSQGAHYLARHALRVCGTKGFRSTKSPGTTIQRSRHVLHTSYTPQLMPTEHLSTVTGVPMTWFSCASRVENLVPHTCSDRVHQSRTCVLQSSVKP